jgi:hypothetical protein
LHRSKLPTELPNAFDWRKFSVTRCYWHSWNKAWWIVCQRTPEIPLAVNNVGRRIPDISEELCDKPIYQLKIPVLYCE